MKTCWLMNSLPNALLTRELNLKPISEEEAKAVVSTYEVLSAVGHESTANLYSNRLGVEVKTNRCFASWEQAEVLLCGLFTPTRRLGEGEKWTEEDILGMSINWVLVTLVK